jgi:DNA-binding NarL/FixJ family response regulator
MNCAYELVRLDRAEEVMARMTEIAAASASALFDIQALHARAAVGQDAHLIEQAAEEFGSRGFSLYAATAFAHASEAARRAGNQRQANAALMRAQDFRSMCDGAMSVASAQSAEAGPIALTRREREIGVLAGQGLGNREIAERLFISKRTTENHVARIYEKFGITSRAELVRLLEGNLALHA